MLNYAYNRTKKQELLMHQEIRYMSLLFCMQKIILNLTTSAVQI